MKFTTHRFNDLTYADLRCLQGLTNDASRGDARDDGGRPGSQFRNMLDARMCAESFPNVHVIIARDGLRAVGWAMMSTRGNSAQVGFYVHPDRRRTGLATSLLELLRDLGIRHGIRGLVASPWNRASTAFFISRGFDVIAKPISGWLQGIAIMELPPTVYTECTPR